MKIINKICSFVFFLVLMSLPQYVFGATLYFNTTSEKIYEGDVFFVGIRIDSKDESINVIEANVDFENELIKLNSFNKVGSILRFWTQEPEYFDKTGVLSFTGGLPNPGYRGPNGLIGLLEFQAIKSGDVSLAFRDSSRVILNNGLGEEAMISKQPLSLTVYSAPDGYEPFTSQNMIDNKPPEAFVPIISQTKYAFQGDYFVFFETVDTDSSISHYEVQEFKDGIWGDWVKTRSPYVLKNQKGVVRVYVKAVDLSGNETIGTAEVNAVSRDFNFFETLAVIGLFLLIIWRVINCHMSK